MIGTWFFTQIYLPGGVRKTLISDQTILILMAKLFPNYLTLSIVPGSRSTKTALGTYLPPLASL